MRTSFLAIAAAVGLASSATAGSTHDRFTIAKRQTTGAPTDLQILNYALTLERLEKVGARRGLRHSTFSEIGQLTFCRALTELLLHGSRQVPP